VNASVDPAVELTGLTKVFGSARALDGVDLSVPAGSIFGFLGPNGAGKSTTINILAGLSHPTSGVARVLGQDITRAGHDVRARVGYLPDVPGFYGWMTGEEFLRFAGRLFVLPADVLDERVPALLDLAGLLGVTTRIGGYSRGMRQRLGLAQALINAPQLLLLDEPTSALDPVGRKEMLTTIAELRGRTTVFFSTHILADVERVCDTVAILDRGKVLVESGIDELRSRGGARVVTLELASPNDSAMLADDVDGKPWLRTVERDGDTLRLTVDDLPAAQQALPALVAARGLALRRLETGETTLEAIFVELVGHRAASGQ
jgi:ABC-2 type transport system ATP-binding protein